MLLFYLVETVCTPSLQLKNLLEILHAVFTQRAFEIGWEGVTFVDIAADLADPATFAVFGFLGRLWFGFYVLLIVVVSHGRLVGKNLGIEHIGDKHRMCAKVDALGDATGQIGVGVFRDIEHMVDGSVFCLAVSEFVHLTSRLETEVFEDLHRGLRGQHRDVEHAGILDKVVGIVALVDRHSNLQGVARDLDHRVDDAAVVDVVVIGGQHIEAVTNVE